MPIYEYECLTCGITFDKRQSFNEEPKADCPNGHKETRRLLATPAIVFKGSGFYVTDNKSSKNGTGETSARSEKSESKSEKAEPTSSESKQKADSKSN